MMTCGRRGRAGWREGLRWLMRDLTDNRIRAHLGAYFSGPLSHPVGAGVSFRGLTGPIFVATRWFSQLPVSSCQVYRGVVPGVTRIRALVQRLPDSTAPQLSWYGCGRRSWFS